MAMYNLLGWTNPSPTTLGYYKFVTFKNIEPLSPSSTCGDGQYTVAEYKIHPSSVVTTGGGPGSYTMTINMASITDQYPYSVCDICKSLTSNYANQINSSISLPNVNYTTNNGLRYDNPFVSYTQIAYAIPTQPIGYLGGAGLYIPYYSTRTLPYSGSPLTFIPSLSATTCDFNWMDFNNLIDPSNGNETQYFYQTFGSYWVIPTDINNPQYFDLYDGWPGGVVIYEVNATYPSGHIVDPNYFI
jgi:hypothetical protein